MKDKELLEWQVKRDVDEMMISAWKWQQKLIDMGINTTKL
jgi:UDP-glucose 4-epimerase